MNPKGGEEPLAFEIYSEDHADVGNYTYIMEIRVKDLIDLDHIVELREIKVEIKPCKITEILTNE